MTERRNIKHTPTPSSYHPKGGLIGRVLIGFSRVSKGVLIGLNSRAGPPLDPIDRGPRAPARTGPRMRSARWSPIWATISGSLAIRNYIFSGFRSIFGQTWPPNPSRTTGLVLQCRLHQKSAPQTNSKAISWQLGILSSPPPMNR